MAEIVTELQLKMVGYVSMDLRLQLILVLNEKMDIIKIMTQILNIESQYVGMGLKLRQKSEMMVMLMMEMADHLHEQLKTKILMDQFTNQQLVRQQLK